MTTLHKGHMVGKDTVQPFVGPGWGGKSRGGLSEEIQLYPEIRPLKFQDHKIKENQFLITFKPQGYRRISTEQHPSRAAPAFQ